MVQHNNLNLAQLLQGNSALNDAQKALLPSLSAMLNEKEGVVTIIVNQPTKELDALRQTLEHALKAVPGVLKVNWLSTVHNNSNTGSVRVEAKSGAKGGVNPPTPKSIAGVKRIIAVASGKGGVGKSTVAANLAVSFAALGLKTGLVDADIYGPSIAKMMHLRGKPEVVNDRMVPPVAHGVHCMSMGMILDEDTPVVWRGPMISKALQQLMLGAKWDNLDVLVIDLPPGTGDIHLSIAQNFTLDGVVMVTTPQQVAVLDVKKAIAMFQKVNVPMLGIIENMSYFAAPDGSKHYLFGEGGGKKLATTLGIPLLGEIPLEPVISSAGDEGTPASVGNTQIAEQFRSIAEVVIKRE